MTSRSMMSAALACALLALAPASAAALTLADNLVAYYPFTGNASNAAGAAGQGTLQNGATFGTDRLGAANSALSTDGVNDYVGLASLATSGIGDFTVSTWFKLAAFNPGGRSYIVDLRGDGSEPNQTAALFIDNSGGNMNVGYYTDVPGQGTVQLFYNAGSGLGVWHQLVMTRAGGTLRGYFDGNTTPVVSSAVGANAMTWTVARIGTFSAQNGAGDYWYNGGIDDVGLWTRALAATEVNTLFTTGVPALGAPEPAGLALLALTLLPLARRRSRRAPRA